VSRYCPWRGRGVAAAAAFVALLSTIPSIPLSAQGDHLVVNYQPSQPTGWPGGNNMSIGAHTPSLEFTRAGETWRISLVSFSQPGDAPDPVYEDIPGDATVDYDQVLTNAFGDHYSFNYAGGLRGQGRFTVLSYNVFVKQPTPTFPVLNYGGEVYVVYDPAGREAVPMNKPLQWIQVVNGTPQPGSYLDNSYRANPFYIVGGLTSIYGNQVVNFADASQQFRGPGPLVDLTFRFTAEAFLVQDTGIKDPVGKDIVNIFSGFKWGWEVQRVTSSASSESPNQRSATLAGASLQH
jgi:hypothetical protein